MSSPGRRRAASQQTSSAHKKAKRADASPSPMEVDQELCRCATEEFDATCLIGIVDKDKARRKWPHREQATFKPVAWPDPAKEVKDLEPSAAVAHAKSARMEVEDEVWMEVKLGDVVAVDHGGADDVEGELEEREDQKHPHWYLRVQELFMDSQGHRWASGPWLLAAWHTHLRATYEVKAKAKDGDKDDDEAGGKPKAKSTRVGKAKAEDGDKEDDEAGGKPRAKPKAGTKPKVVNKRHLATEGLDHNRLFNASVEDSAAQGSTVLLGSIQRVVEVEEVAPGCRPLSNGLYVQGEYDRAFVTFSDGPNHVPASRAKYAGKQRVLRCLDLYSGCGGTSFVDLESAGVVIKTTWAVDKEESMTASFKVNHPNAEVWTMDMDLYYRFIKKWPAFREQQSQRRPYMPGANTRAGKDVEAILSVTVGSSVKRGTSGQAKGLIIEAVTDDNSWLEFKVRNDKGKIECLKQEDLLKRCTHTQVHTFVKEMTARKAIPMPDDDDLVIMGGPPCQGVSGLNRHATHTSTLDDVRNRQVSIFYDIIEYLQPAYVIMEQVLDTWKKEGGLYTRYASGRLLEAGYQSRQGCIAAGDHGVPQCRWRSITWGALSGQEQLPPFPQPTHQFAAPGGLPAAAALCRVGFQSLEAFDKAYPMAVTGDIFSDLPEVHTWQMAEGAEYASKPQTPNQAWLRRAPPTTQPSLAERTGAADAIHGPQTEVMTKNLMRMALSMPDRPARVPGPEEEPLFVQLPKNEIWAHKLGGAVRLERRGGSAGGAGNPVKEQKADHDHNVATVDTILAGSDPMSALPPEQREMVAANLRQAAIASDFMNGLRLQREIIKAHKQAREPAAYPLADHRPLGLNDTDQARVASIPKRPGASMRDAHGVVRHPAPNGKGGNGQLCAGHTHAQAQAQAHGNIKYRGCPVGNNPKPPKKGAPGHRRGVKWLCSHVKGCKATTSILGCGSLQCPFWCVTYKGGVADGRHACYGRINPGEIQGTVVTRAEPHNLCLIHPEQDRVVTIRENARCQGFPDYYALVGHTRSKATRQGLVRCSSVTDRYVQMGNAVCPQVAAALGRCLALAAVGGVPAGQAVVDERDQAYDQCMKEARAEGLRCWAEQPGQGVQSKHGGWFPKVYAEQLEKKREGLKKRLSMGSVECRKRAAANDPDVAESEDEEEAEADEDDDEDDADNDVDD